MERRLGADFSAVRVHDDGSAARSAADFQAAAYASGVHVVLGSAASRPAVRERLLAHELTHVAQQQRTWTGGPVPSEAAAERQAHAVAHGTTAGVVRDVPGVVRRADPAAIGRVMGQGTTVGTGLQFWPTNVVDTRVGFVSGQGGLLLGGLNRLHVILGSGVTLRGLARALLPLWTTATPFTPPGGGAPLPVDPLDAEQLARGLLAFNQFYLPALSMERWRAGLTFPLPVEIDPDTGIATLHPGIVLAQAASLDAALLPQLDLPTATVVAATPAELQARVDAFVAEHPDALARGIHLGALTLVNSRAERPFVEALFRQLSPAEGFEAALSFMDFLVNLQVERIASQQDGAGILQVIRGILGAAPTTPTATVQERLDRANRMLGRAAVIVARAPTAARAAGTVTFSELPTERFAGFDPTVTPRFLTIPTGEDRHVAHAATPSTAVPTFVSLNPAIATFVSTADQLEVHGVADGATEIEAREGANRVGRLRVEVKDERQRATAFHFVRDSAAPTPHAATAAPTAATMVDTLNTVWQRQANVRFSSAGAHNITVPGDLGVAVDDNGFGGGEMATVTALGAAAPYRVFRVWHTTVNGGEVNGGLNNGANTLLSNTPCGDGHGLPHEAGHAMGRVHGDGGVMSPCGVRNNIRVTHRIADLVNP